ncbi:MAG: hypothetical protein AAB957_00310 [Patescibacteria group bacterium]
MSNKNGIEFLLEVNEKNSRDFVAQQEKRRLYRRMYGTEFAALKCMDGRLHFPDLTRTPLGIIQPYRNLGGIFHLGWPFFQQAIESWKKYASSKDRDSVVFVTYHFSRGSEHRGCKGHGYDTNKALDFSLNLKNEFDFVYRSSAIQSYNKLFAIQVGIETDWESLILHGEGNEVMDLANIKDASEDGIFNLLISLYPSIYTVAPNVIRDFVPLVQGNILHVQEIKASDRPVQEADHRESVLAVGRGFDWIHLPNKALIVGPWQDNLSEPIKTAASLIKYNIDEGRLNNDKIVLLTSGAYREVEGEEPRLAKLKSLYLRDIAFGVIKKDFGELLPRLQVLVTTVDLNTRKINVIE